MSLYGNILLFVLDLFCLASKYCGRPAIPVAVEGVIIYIAAVEYRSNIQERDLPNPSSSNSSHGQLFD
jgi:hypothetical protein